MRGIVCTVHRYIKAVGSGQKRARDLDRDEAREAMGLVADGKARPEQVGAFLLALRMKGEAAAELAGFVDALEARMTTGAAPPGTLDVDCHGDGHEGRASLLPAAACAAAALGVPVLLRVQLDNAYARHGLVPSLRALGLDVAQPFSRARATQALAQTKLGVLDLAAYCEPLSRLVALRPLFGVRTVAQTLMKLVDPMRATAQLVGVFHAPYLPATAQAMSAMGRARALCVQALGGLPEPAPGKIVRVCAAGEAEPRVIDLRQLGDASPAEAARSDGDDEDGAQLNLAALAGAPAAVARAAAAAGLMLHAARAMDPLAAAAAARRVLESGAARAVAEGLKDM
jgi:anthranilate phosphoribosyltransferase